MKIERINTLKLSVDESREIYLLFTTEGERHFVNVYSAYTDDDTLNLVFGVFCNDVPYKTNDEDMETEIVNIIMKLVRIGEVQWANYLMKILNLFSKMNN